jgi:uncharacterized membrane protein
MRSVVTDRLTRKAAQSIVLLWGVSLILLVVSLAMGVRLVVVGNWAGLPGHALVTVLALVLAWLTWGLYAERVRSGLASKEDESE